MRLSVTTQTALCHLLGVAASAIFIVVAAPAMAQDTATDCVVTPETQREAKGDTAGQDVDTLTDCNGVLKPAPIGDRELVEPAPDAGETPVIEPEDIPAQTLEN
ncbi:MAG: hypothetical protein Tsb0019_41860 [Roseibium sp.]